MSESDRPHLEQAREDAYSAIRPYCDGRFDSDDAHEVRRALDTLIAAAKREGYDTGYGDGERSRSADYMAVLNEADLIPDGCEAEPMEVARLWHESLAAAKREGVREMSPDFLMGEDGEVGFPVSDLGDLADDLNLDPGEVRRVLAYRQLPDRWLAHVVLTRDSDGAPDETEPQLFDSEAEALAALAEKGQP